MTPPLVVKLINTHSQDYKNSGYNGIAVRMKSSYRSYLSFTIGIGTCGAIYRLGFK
jgi:hypothetical protein